MSFWVQPQTAFSVPQSVLSKAPAREKKKLSLVDPNTGKPIDLGGGEMRCKHNTPAKSPHHPCWMLCWFVCMHCGVVKRCRQVAYTSGHQIGDGESIKIRAMSKNADGLCILTVRLTRAAFCRVQQGLSEWYSHPVHGSRDDVCACKVSI